MKPNMIVFMGGQGSGKGTFANMLLKKHDYNYVEVGNILRQMPQDSEIGQIISRGELLTDEVLFPIVSKYIRNDKDVILDGFPRTIGQAQWIVKSYANVFDIKVIFLAITEEKMIARIKKRLQSGEHRADDANENAVKKRIESFKNITMPAIEWLRNCTEISFKELHIQSDDIESNFRIVLEALK